MAELPDINIEQAMADAGMGQGGPPGGLPPGAPAGGPPGAPPEGMPAGMPGEGGVPSADEIESILAGLDEEAMVAPPEAAGPAAPDFSSIMDRFKSEGDDQEKQLLSSRVEELESQLAGVMDRFKQQKVQSETVRVRTAIDRAVKGAMKDVVTGHNKLDKAAADFVEGTLVYRLAQQQQKNPQAPVDTDAITRFATKAAQALSRWAKEHSKKSEVETRRASVGTTTRPKAEDFELKTDADFDKYVAAFIGKGG